MTISFKGGKTSQVMTINTTKKTYSRYCGIASGVIVLDTAKELDKLEITLINGGYKAV